jgi:hypothetical protein
MFLLFLVALAIAFFVASWHYAPIVGHVLLSHGTDRYLPAWVDLHVHPENLDFGEALHRVIIIMVAYIIVMGTVYVGTVFARELVTLGLRLSQKQRHTCG